MSNSPPTFDSMIVLAESKPPACQLVTAAAHAACEGARDVALPLRTIGRPDTLTAQRVEVSLVLQAMLGMSAATDYLAKHDVDIRVMQRVLNPACRRRGSHDANGIRT